MIASGGLDFDDIGYNRSSSSEEDSNKGKLSNRSDISTDSSSSMSTEYQKMAQKNIPPSYISNTINSNAINQKKMVMSEIKRKVFSSDSERENEIFDSIDGCEFGRTPPRETRRNKSRYKCIKFNNNSSSLSVKRKQVKSEQLAMNNHSNFVWQKQRDEERKEKQIEKIEQQTNEEIDVTQRSTKLLRVNSAKNLKSITHQKTLNSFTKYEESIGPSKFMSSAVRFSTKHSDVKKSSTSREHFYKSFSLLVNLGGRIPSQNYKSFDVNDEEESDNFQVEYHEFLWLQLQAYHAARSVEDQDNYLEEARREVDTILDSVISFQFDFDQCTCSNHYDLSIKNCDVHSQTSNDEDDEFVTFKTSFDVDEEGLASTPMVDARSEQIFPKNENENPTSLDRLTESFGKMATIHKEKVDEKVFDLSSLRDQKVAAMHDVMALLQKVESVETLYPNMKALTAAHPKYKDIRFVRNMEALLLWLNINKELYHQLNNLADWIDIDPDDFISWKDWFDCGLESHCVKTRKSYQTSHNIATGESLESSVNLPSLLTNFALRKSKRDKRKRISMNRLSFIEKTSTSRYRLFVERSIKENGLIQIMKRTRNMLEFPLLKAKYCLTDQSEIESEYTLKRQKKVAAMPDDLLTLFKMFINLNDHILVKYFSETQQKNDDYKKYTHFSKAFQDMRLPSFVDIYSFLLMVPFDVVHECIRFRLDYKPKMQPSQHSIRQLILECKEVLSGGLICLHHFKEMSTVIPDKKKEMMIQRKEEFDDDLKAILNVYFDYVQVWLKMMQKSKGSGESLTNILEEEWNFSKKICPYIGGAEARAGYKICCLSSSLLKSTEVFIGSSVEECCAKYNPANNTNIQRHKMLTACREYKEIFKEARSKACKVLGIAKMLHKDLGIANKYTMNCSTELLFKLLKSTKHFKVDYHGINVDFWIFISCDCSKKEDFPTKLLNLTFGMDDSSYYGDGYVLLVPKVKKEKSLWLGRRISLEYTNAVSLAISYIEKVNHVTIICNNSYHLNTQSRKFEQCMDNMVTLAVERTSSHNTIENSLNELKESTNRLAKILISSVEHVYDNLYMGESTELDEADRNSTHKSCVETMHLCFSVGFEYLRELIRMYHGRSNTGISDYFVKFSRMWMQFVMSKIDQGRGTKPRWAVPGLEFLVATIEPNNTASINEREYKSLQKEMQDCVRHVIGQAESRAKRKFRADKRSNSPFAVHRSRSVPSQKKDGNQSFDNSLGTQVDPSKSFSLPVEFSGDMHSGGSLQDVSNNSTISSEGDTIDSASSETILEGDTIVENDPPLIRVRNAIKEIDERRTAKLQHMRVIGNVTYKKPNLASELVHNVRRVNFKWQLGNKIGEGQFGKVYSAVNLDTGDLMAVKQVRFNPHDYGTIQEIADEITNIQNIQHDSLVKYFGVELHKDEMMIFMEYCADGTIAEVAKLGLPESLIRVYTYQITRAINFLHQSGVVHRDIKGANIFLSSSGLIKIGDFGSAVKLKDAMCTSQGEVFNTRGTAAFMAPEVITLDKGRGYGRAADIWSLGCVVIEMATGKQPWYECDNIYAIMYRVGDGNHPPVPDRLSEEGKDFLQCCFIHDQNYRWTAHMLEDHVFVKCC